MSSENYSTTFIVDQTPDEAFATITNRARMVVR
jgi:hypothetical protein